MSETKAEWDNNRLVHQLRGQINALEERVRAAEAKNVCICREYCNDCDALIFDHQDDDYPGWHDVGNVYECPKHKDFAAEFVELRDALAASESARQAAEGRAVLAMGGQELERLAALVHQAYLDACVRLGWPVKPSDQVPYEVLHEDSKELDRASVRVVLNALSFSVPVARDGEAEA